MGMFGTRHQFESCGIWLEFSRFNIDAQRRTILLVVARKNALEDVSAASLALHAQKFASATEKNVVTKFTSRLSRTLNKICKYKNFIWPKFSRMWTESKDIYFYIFYSEWRISLISPETCTLLNKNNSEITLK